MEIIEPSISVVIPTADRGTRLASAIQCVQHQTTSANEIIIVDNGRANACINGLDFVTVVRTDPYIGPGAARNIGAKVAKSEYIAFLDDDDSWQLDYLQQVSQAIQDHNADVVVARLMRKDVSGIPKDYKTFPTSVAEQRQIYHRNPGFGGQNFTIKRSTFMELGGFDETLPASEDRDFAARLLQAGKRLLPCPSAIAVLNDHEGPRARASLLTGNRMFLQKHWRAMTNHERIIAASVLGKRWLKVFLNQVMQNKKNA